MTTRSTRSNNISSLLAGLDDDDDDDDDLINIDLTPHVLDVGAEEEEQQNEAPDAASTSSSKKEKEETGLKEDQTVQLFLDVQDNGGIDQCEPAKEIYNVKPKLYGSSGSALRRKFRNKVDYWKNTNRGRIEYNKRVTTTGIVPSLKPKTAPTKVKAKTAKVAPARSVRSKTSSTVSSSFTPLKPVLSSPSRPNPFQHHSAGPSNSMSISNAFAKLHLMAITQQNSRTANWEQPERNGGTVLISILSELELNKFHRHGFLLQIKSADVRFIMDNKEWFKCFVVLDSEVIVQFPSVPWTFFNDPAAAGRGRNLANDNNPRNILSDRVLRTGIRAEEDRQLTTMLFKFEEGEDGETHDIFLDNSLFSPNESNGRVKPHIIPQVPPPAAGGQLSAAAATHVDIYYVVGIHEENPSRIEEVSTGSNPLAAELSKMGLGKRSSRDRLSRAARAPAPAAAPAAPAPAPAPAAESIPKNYLVPNSDNNVENSDWDFMSPAPAPGPSSLQLALVSASNGTAGTEMLEFMDQDVSDSPPKEQSTKRRAVLLAGAKVWEVDQVSNETLLAFNEVNSEAIVAIHPITKEHRTHSAVMAHVETKAFTKKMTTVEAVDKLKELGATDHQSAMNILFPTAAV